MLIQIFELFMRFGIKSQTMDDIARSLKVSKKTLYKFSTDKSDLVQKVMLNYCESQKELSREVFEKYENPIDELVEITKHVSTMLTNFHPSVHYDLEKYYPQAWNEFQNMKSDFHFKSMKRNLEMGIEQGYYRENLNTAVIARLHIEKMDMVFNADLFPVPAYSFKEVFVELMRYHLRGISNEKGVKYLQKISKENQLNLI